MLGLLTILGLCALCSLPGRPMVLKMKNVTIKMQSIWATCLGILTRFQYGDNAADDDAKRKIGTMRSWKL